MFTCSYTGCTTSFLTYLNPENKISGGTLNVPTCDCEMTRVVSPFALNIYLIYSTNTYQTLPQPPHVTPTNILILEDQLHKIQCHILDLHRSHRHILVSPQIEQTSYALIDTDDIYSKIGNKISENGQSLQFSAKAALINDLTNSSSHLEPSSICAAVKLNSYSNAKHFSMRSGALVAAFPFRLHTPLLSNTTLMESVFRRPIS